MQSWKFGQKFHSPAPRRKKPPRLAPPRASHNQQYLKISFGAPRRINLPLCFLRKTAGGAGRVLKWSFLLPTLIIWNYTKILKQYQD